MELKLDLHHINGVVSIRRFPGNINDFYKNVFNLQHWPGLIDTYFSERSQATNVSILRHGFQTNLQEELIDENVIKSLAVNKIKVPYLIKTISFKHYRIYQTN